MARETCFLILTLSIVVPVIFLVLYLIPHPPKLQVVSLKTSPIIFTPFVSNQPSTLMSATWNLTFIAKNPNKRLQLHYRDVNVSVYYQQLILLSSLTLTSFKQSEEGEVVEQVSGATSVVLSNQSAAAMVKDKLEDLSLNFIVRFRGTVVVYVATFIGIGVHDLSIDCVDVKVVFSPQNGTGTMLDPTRKCHSNHLIF